MVPGHHEMVHQRDGEEKAVGRSAERRRDTTHCARVFLNPNQPQWLEIYRLEDQNLKLYDQARMIGKAMADVPLPPGFSKFGDDVFNYYGHLRDQNNAQIDQLVQQMYAQQ